MRCCCCCCCKSLLDRFPFIGIHPFYGYCCGLFRDLHRVCELKTNSSLMDASIRMGCLRFACEHSSVVTLLVPPALFLSLLRLGKQENSKSQILRNIVECLWIRLISTPVQFHIDHNVHPILKLPIRHTAHSNCSAKMRTNILMPE